MNSADFQKRSKGYALAVIRLVKALPRDPITDVMSKQLMRCATSVGANYRAACRAKSPADFVAKMGIVDEEADESLYWMELLIDGGFVPAAHLGALRREGQEILAMTVAFIRTTKAGARNQLKEEQIPYELEQTAGNRAE